MHEKIKVGLCKDSCDIQCPTINLKNYNQHQNIQTLNSQTITNFKKKPTKKFHFYIRPFSPLYIHSLQWYQQLQSDTKFTTTQTNNWYNEYESKERTAPMVSFCFFFQGQIIAILTKNKHLM